jgi:putative MFS transporter
LRSHLELAAVRFIAGLGLGGELPVVTSYVSELSPPERRGRNVVLLESFWSLGALAAAAVAYFLFPALGWRNAMLLLAATALYAAVIRSTLPEHKPQKRAALSIYAYFRRLAPTWYIWFVLAFGSSRGARQQKTRRLRLLAASALAFAHSQEPAQLYLAAPALNFFNLGVVYAYTPELFPDHVRGPPRAPPARWRGWA